MSNHSHAARYIGLHHGVLYLADEILGFEGHVGRVVDVHSGNLAVGGTLALRLERWVACDELIREDAQCPHVHPVVVIHAANHLRGKLVTKAWMAVRPHAEHPHTLRRCILT